MKKLLFSASIFIGALTAKAADDAHSIVLPVVGVFGFFILLFCVITIPGYGIAVYVEYRVAKKMGVAFAKGGPFQTASMLQVLAPLLGIFLYPILPGSTYKPEWFGISDRWANTAGIAGLLGVLALALGAVLIVCEKSGEGRGTNWTNVINRADQAGEVPRGYSVVFLIVCLVDAFFIWSEYNGFVGLSRPSIHPGGAWNTAWDIDPVRFRIPFIVDLASVVVAIGGYVAKKKPGGLWSLATGIALITGLCGVLLMTGFSTGL